MKTDMLKSYLTLPDLEKKKLLQNPKWAAVLGEFHELPAAEQSKAIRIAEYEDQVHQEQAMGLGAGEMPMLDIGQSKKAAKELGKGLIQYGAPLGAAGLVGKLALTGGKLALAHGAAQAATETGLQEAGISEGGLAGTALAGAIPVAGAALTAPARWMASKVAQYLPGYAMAAHRVAQMTLQAIPDTYVPTMGAHKPMYDALESSGVRIGVLEMWDSAQSILTNQLAKAPTLRNSSVMDAAKGVLATIGTRTNVYGAAAPARSVLPISKIRELQKDIWNLMGKGRVKGETVKEVGTIYRDTWHAMEFTAQLLPQTGAAMLTKLKEANRLYKLEKGFELYRDHAGKALSEAGEAGGNFTKANVNGLLKRLRGDDDFKTLVGTKVYDGVRARLLEAAPPPIASASEWWAATAGRAIVGAGLGAGAGSYGGGSLMSSALGALVGAAGAMGVSQASMTPRGQAFTTRMGNMPAMPQSFTSTQTMAQELRVLYGSAPPPRGLSRRGEKTTVSTLKELFFPEQKEGTDE